MLNNNLVLGVLGSPELSVLFDDLQCIGLCFYLKKKRYLSIMRKYLTVANLILWLTIEGKLVGWLSIRNLVVTEPVVNGSNVSRASLFEISNIWT